MKTIAAFIDEIHIHLRWLDSWRWGRAGDPIDHRAHISAIYAMEAARRLGVEVPQPMLREMTKASDETKWFEELEKNAIKRAHSGTPPGPIPEAVETLPDWEDTIVVAIQTSKKPLRNHGDVAKAAGYQYNSNFKGHMADLARRKIIAKTGGKYVVKSQDHGQDDGQD